MNETVPSPNGLEMRGVRGVRLHKFSGNHLQIFNEMSVLEQVAHMGTEDNIHCAISTPYVILVFNECVKGFAN